YRRSGGNGLAVGCVGWAGGARRTFCSTRTLPPPRGVTATAWPWLGARPRPRGRRADDPLSNFSGPGLPFSVGGFPPARVKEGTVTGAGARKTTGKGGRVLRVAGLFAGVGGIELGLHRTLPSRPGVRTVAVEAYPPPPFDVSRRSRPPTAATPLHRRGTVH